MAHCIPIKMKLNFFLISEFNPWKGIRFSTYSFTCLMRALPRLNYKHTDDKLAQYESRDNMIGNSLTRSFTCSS